MAGETKVGLLAGLAFIVCFAIILANRGRQEPVRTRPPYRVDSGGNVQRAAGVPSPRPKPVQPPGTRSHDPRAVDPAKPLTISSRPRPTSIRTDGDAANDTATSAPTSGAKVVLGVHAGSVSGPALRRQTEEPSQKRTVSESLAGGTNFDSSALPSVTNATGNRTLVQPPSRSSPAPASSAPTLSAPATSPGSVRYTVASGDTLWKIAATRYGSKSPRIITAIFEANRSLLSSPDLLPVGVELTLPAVEGLNLTPGGNLSIKAQTPKAVGEHGFRWYQIKKNDRYISIARKQLGDARRWREIHELNKDRFADPHLIRDGVLIKLPGTRP